MYSTDCEGQTRLGIESRIIESRPSETNIKT